MRRVTRKPPNMLMPVIKIDTAASRITKDEPEPICISAPRMMIEEIAFVTAISGVCKLCATPQMTWKPDKDRQNKNDKVLHKACRGNETNTQQKHAPTASNVTCCLVCALNAAVSAARFSSGVSLWNDVLLA